MATLKSIKNKYLASTDGTLLGVSDNADNVALLAFKMQASDSIAKFNMVDGFSDAYVDATGVDASASTNEILASGYYKGTDTTSVTPTTSGGTLSTYTENSIAYSVRTFTSTDADNFITDTALTADILIVGGGGTGDFQGVTGGQGGGAGGFKYYNDQPVSAATHAIVVGAGGTASSPLSPPSSADGNNSSFSGSLVAFKGNGADFGSGTSYGSKGGGGGGTHTPNQGNTSSSTAGGGAAEAGGTDGTGHGGDGYTEGTSTVYDWTLADGTTTTFHVNGTSNSYAGGGSGNGVAGGTGGGGSSSANGGVGGSGGTNTGGGGGGADDGGGGMNRGGHGGSGIVVVRYTTTVSVLVDANLTLVSNSATALAQPDLGDIVMTYTNGAGTATINTDLKAWVSRDGGTTYTQGTLVSEGTTGSDTVLTSRGIDISGQPAGTSMRYKITTHNQSASKVTRIQAASLAWG